VYQQEASWWLMDEVICAMVANELINKKVSV
jgi:hypothetical protein